MTKLHPGNELKDIPEPPDRLTNAAREEWQAIAPIIFQLKTGRPAELRRLELLAELLADIRSMEATIRAEGYT